MIKRVEQRAYALFSEGATCVIRKRLHVSVLIRLYPSICPSIGLSVCPSICQFCLSVCPSNRLSGSLLLSVHVKTYKNNRERNVRVVCHGATGGGGCCDSDGCTEINVHTSPVLYIRVRSPETRTNIDVTVKGVSSRGAMIRWCSPISPAARAGFKLLHLSNLPWRLVSDPGEGVGISTYINRKYTVAAIDFPVVGDRRQYINIYLDARK